MMFRDFIQADAYDISSKLQLIEYIPIDASQASLCPWE
jgi:hypothetical protein